MTAGTHVASCAAPQLLRVRFFNVGYGDAILVEFPDASCMLIDAGDHEHARQLNRQLQSLNIQSIDTVVITHPHKNHFEGLAEIVEHIPIGRVFINGDRNAEEGYGQLLEKFHQRQISVRTLKRGDSLENLPEPIHIDVLHPDDLSGSPNGNSLVLWLKFKKTSVVFTGDIEPPQQEDILRLYEGITSSSVIKVPHHGGPLSEAFIKAFPDNNFIISTGPNQWGWPPEYELKRLKGRIFRTDIDGTIVLESDGSLVSIRGEADRKVK